MNWEIPKEPIFWIAAGILGYLAYQAGFKAGTAKGSTDSA